MIEVKVYCNKDEETGEEFSYTQECETEQEARHFCEEEVKWESCKRVLCKQLNIDMKGDFAS